MPKIEVKALPLASIPVPASHHKEYPDAHELRLWDRAKEDRSYEGDDHRYAIERWFNDDACYNAGSFGTLSDALTYLAAQLNGVR